MKKYRVIIEGCPTDYIMGRIMGIIAALTFDETGKRDHLAISRHYDDEHEVTHHIVRILATEDEFTLIKKVIDRTYPFTCTFE